MEVRGHREGGGWLYTFVHVKDAFAVDNVEVDLGDDGQVPLSKVTHAMLAEHGQCMIKDREYIIGYASFELAGGRLDDVMFRERDSFYLNGKKITLPIPADQFEAVAGTPQWTVTYFRP